MVNLAAEARNGAWIIDAFYNGRQPYGELGDPWCCW